jgi:hypothetical protein
VSAGNVRLDGAEASRQVLKEVRQLVEKALNLIDQSQDHVEIGARLHEVVELISAKLT